MTTNSPRISICIPAYNAGRWLARSIDSALAQQPEDAIEVIVVDNASTDDTADVLERYRGRPRLRQVSAAEHLPMAANWNRTVDLARGQWVVLLCADDELLPDFAANVWPHLNRSELAIIGQFSLVYDGEPPELRCVNGARQPLLHRREATIAEILTGSSPFNVSTTLFRRSAFDAVGGFRDRGAGIVADWDLWVRMLLTQGAAFSVGAGGVRYYEDRGSTWRSAIHDGSYLGIWGRLIQNLEPALPGDLGCLARQTLAEEAVGAGNQRASSGDLRAARASLRAGVRYGAGPWRGRALTEYALSHMVPYAILARLRARVQLRAKIRAVLARAGTRH